MKVGFDTIGNAILICYDQGSPVLVTDPWITGSAYLGSWNFSHEIPAEQLTAIRNTRYVWLSHGHPDHLQAESIEQLRSAYPEAAFPAMDDAFVREVLEGLCVGLRTFDEIREAGLLSAMQARLSPEQAKLLAREVPERITLAGGRSVRVSYQPGKPP